MDGETNGGQQETQKQEAAQVRQQAAQGRQEVAEGGIDGTDWVRQIAERDARIAELEGQVAEAARSAEAAGRLRGEISEVRAQAESDRLDFRLQLAGCRNVKAARAILADYDGDVDRLRRAEPWLFARHMAGASGTTGLPNAGAASDEGKAVRHWREVAGLSDEGEA